MSREALKPIQVGKLKSRSEREVNKMITTDKENIIQNENSEQKSKGAIPKVPVIKGILKPSKSVNPHNSKISSTLSLSPIEPIQPKRRKISDKKDAYSRVAFAIYDENREKIPTIKIGQEQAEKEVRVSFRKSKEYFLHQERNSAQYNIELNSPLATKYLKKLSFADTFNEARKAFIIREEIENIQKRFESLTISKHTDNENISRFKFPRVAQLRSENTESESYFTPHDVDNVLPVQEPIKIAHKNGHADIIQRPAASFDKWLSSAVSQFSYNEDIMKFFLDKEKSRKQFESNFRQWNTTSKQYKILIKHLIKIIKDYNYPSYITYPIVRLMNDVLDSQKISIEQLQLIELTSMWIVMKNLLIAYNIPELSKIISFSNGAYTKKDLLKYEVKILETLNFDISYADPSSAMIYSMISHDHAFLLPGDLNSIYYCGSYMLDVALFNEELMAMSPTLLGCVAAEISLKLNLVPEETFSDPDLNPWRTNFAKANFTRSEILNMQSFIVRQIIRSGYKDNAENIVYKKYSRSRYGRISYMLIHGIVNVVSQNS